MTKHTLLLSALTLCPLVAQEQDPQTIFDALSSPAREMQTAPASEIYSTRAAIPAGDYELIADARMLPFLRKSFNLPALEMPIEAATICCTKGNIPQLMEALPALNSINSHIYNMEYLKNDEEQLEKLKADPGDHDDEYVKNRIEYMELTIERGKKTQKRELELVLKLLNELPVLSLQPVYISCRLSEPRADEVIEKVTSEAIPHMKASTALGMKGFELDLSTLPEEYAALAQSKLKGNPTVYFQALSAQEVLIIVGSGTEALDGLKSGAAKMDSPSITVAREQLGHLWVDVSVMKAISDQQQLEKYYDSQLILDSDDEEDIKTVHSLDVLISSLTKILPQFTAGLGAQLWMQDGDIYAKLSTAMSNYQMETAPRMLAHLAAQPDTDFYMELSPLSTEDGNRLSDAVNSGALFFINVFGLAKSEDNAENALAAYKTKHEKVIQAGRESALALTRNLGYYAKTGEPYSPEAPNLRKTSGVMFVGVEDMDKLSKNLLQLKEAYINITQDKEFSILLDSIDKAINSKKEDYVHIRSSAQRVALGDDLGMVEATVASGTTSDAPTMSGALFMLRGHPLNVGSSEAPKGIYIRLDSNGEKKDVYFKLDMPN